MLRHENPNIEIVKKNLWAVRFSLIPLIPQLNWNPDPSVDWNQVPFQFAKDADVVLLNKDYKHCEAVKQAYSSVIGMKPKKIRGKLAAMAKAPVTNPYQVVLMACMKAEIEREKMKKGGVT